MKNPLIVIAIASMISMVFISCEKQTKFKPKTPEKYELKEDFVVLPVGSSYGEDKSFSDEKSFTEQYNFPVNDKEGIIEISLNEDAQLSSARMTTDIYHDLLSRVNEEDINALPQELLNQSIQLRKLGFDFWSSSNFILKMSEEEFDRRFNKCTDKPTEVGVLLCTMNLIVTALNDCMQASPFTKSIHCW